MYDLIIDRLLIEVVSSGITTIAGQRLIESVSRGALPIIHRGADDDGRRTKEQKNNGNWFKCLSWLT